MQTLRVTNLLGTVPATRLLNTSAVKTCGRALAVPILAIGVLVLVACEQGRAPADWAERNRVTTGDPQGGAQPVDPKDARATQDVRPGQERFWTLVVAGLVIGSALTVAAGTWYFEMRRRARWRARGEVASEPPRRPTAR